MFTEFQCCVSPWLPVPATGWTLGWLHHPASSFALLLLIAGAGRESHWQPGLSQAPWEAFLNDGLQGPVNLVDVAVKKKGSVLHAGGRQLKIGSFLSLGKVAAVFAMLTCLIIRNSAVAEIHSLNIISKTAVAAGLQPSCWSTRKSKTRKF